MKYSLSLSTPYGEKDLYQACGICEFFDFAPEEFKRVEFNTFQEADNFAQKYKGNNSCIFIVEIQ